MFLSLYFRRWIQLHSLDICILLETFLSSQSLVHAKWQFPLLGTFILLSLKVWHWILLLFGDLVLLILISFIDILNKISGSSLTKNYFRSLVSVDFH